MLVARGSWRIYVVENIFVKLLLLQLVMKSRVFDEPHRTTFLSLDPKRSYGSMVGTNNFSIEKPSHVLKYLSNFVTYSVRATQRIAGQ